jgi:hypothetical protein
MATPERNCSARKERSEEEWQRASRQSPEDDTYVVGQRVIVSREETATANLLHKVAESG